MALNPMLLIPVLPKPDELTAFARTCPTPPDVEVVPCLGCYQLSGFARIIVDPDRGICMGQCSKCRWPMHNNLCEVSESHQIECEFLRNLNTNPNNNFGFSHLPNDFMCIGVLRAILLQRDNGPVWASLMRMPIEVQRRDPRYTIPEYLRMQEVAEQRIKTFIYDKCRISQTLVTEAQLDHLIRVIKSNQLPSPCLNHYNKPFVNMIFYGFEGRALTHSCRPNCFIHQDVKSLQCSVWTLRDIKAGETLTINYDAGGIQGLRGLSLLSRAIFLQNELGCSPCKCSMCSDPTEDGTYFSAIHCIKKKCPGFIIPTEPTNWAQSAIWKCNMEKCKETMTMVEVQKRVILFNRAFKTQAVYNESALLNVTKEFAISVLHPNHYRILAGYIKISEVLLMRMGDKEQYLSEGNIVPGRFVFHQNENPNYLEVFQRVMGFYNLAQPGSTFLYMQILFFASLIRISAMAECSRDASFENDEDKTSFLKLKDEEFGRVIRDLNQSIHSFRTHTYVDCAPEQFITNPMFLLKAYCVCLTMAVKPIFPATFDVENSAFRQIIQEDWESELRDGTYGNLFMFQI